MAKECVNPECEFPETCNSSCVNSRKSISAVKLLGIIFVVVLLFFVCFTMYYHRDPCKGCCSKSTDTATSKSTDVTVKELFTEGVVLPQDSNPVIQDAIVNQNCEKTEEQTINVVTEKPEEQTIEVVTEKPEEKAVNAQILVEDAQAEDIQILVEDAKTTEGDIQPEDAQTKEGDIQPEDVQTLVNNEQVVILPCNLNIVTSTSDQLILLDNKDCEQPSLETTGSVEHPITDAKIEHLDTAEVVDSGLILEQKQESVGIAETYLEKPSSSCKNCKSCKTVKVEDAPIVVAL